MFFDKKNKKIANERTIYQSRPNMVLGCKKAIYGVILLVFLFWVSNPIKSFIADMQMYAISYIKFGLTGYTMLAIVLLMLVDLVYIIWQLLLWYSTQYTITNRRIISKRGILNSKKTYMPFRSIQDIDLSQSILERIFDIGTVTAYSAYDNNSMVLSNIHNPSEVEDILFNQMNNEIIPEHTNYENKRTYRKPQREEYYYDDYEPKINKTYMEEEDFLRSKGNHNQYEYEEYPDYSRVNKHQYDYEYYDDNLEDNLSYAMNNMDRRYDSRKEDSELYYNDYDYDSMEEFYQNNKDEIYVQHEKEDSSEDIVQRHFDKFNRWILMELLLIQSQEHPKLPLAELKAVMECEEIHGTLKPITEGLVILDDIPQDNFDEYYKTLTRRLGYTHEVHEVIDTFPKSQLEEKIIAIDWKKYIAKNFAVRVKKFYSTLDTVDVERKVGSLILSSIDEDNIKVKLSNPESPIKIVSFKNKIYLTIERIKLNKKHFEDIKPHKRPFFYPGSMSPKLARCMVNLSRVKENELLLDPFCGTGGILIEAGLIGCKVAGSDINWKMKNGTAINLRYCGVENFRTFNVDVRELRMYEKASAIVTDPPYGISTSTGDMKGNTIFIEFFTSIYNNMKDDAFLCMASPHYIDLEPIANSTGFKIMEQYYIKMHRSLTRVITVLKKDLH